MQKPLLPSQLLLFFIPFHNDHQKFFMFHKCSIKSFTTDLQVLIYHYLSFPLTQIWSFLSLQHVSVSKLFSRWKVQLSNNSWSLSQFLSFFFGNGLSFGLFGWKVILGLKKRCFETFCLKQQKRSTLNSFQTDNISTLLK